MNLLQDYSVDYHFPSSLYRAKCPDFLKVIRPIVKDYLKQASVNNIRDEIYPVTMTDNMLGEDSIQPFNEYIANSAWQILNSQGYNMDMFYAHISSLWVQSHDKSSGMDYHIHGEGQQLTGFYFVDVPDDCDVAAIIHDPRQVKVYANLPRRPGNDLVLADDTVLYKPEAGDLYFTNAWLPHSFTKNRSETPLNFIHINIGVTYNPDYKPSVCEPPIII